MNLLSVLDHWTNKYLDLIQIFTGIFKDVTNQAELLFSVLKKTTQTLDTEGSFRVSTGVHWQNCAKRFAQTLPAQNIAPASATKSLLFEYKIQPQKLSK